MEKSLIERIEEQQKECLIVPDKEKSNNDVNKSDNNATPPQQDNLNFEKPVLQKHTDMQELLLLDPIHEIDEKGWPSKK